jgi:autotransporter-associated beta strand protein
MNLVGNKRQKERVMMMTQAIEKKCGGCAIMLAVWALGVQGQEFYTWTNMATSVQNWSGANWSPATPANGGSADTVLNFGVNTGTYTANNDFSATPFALRGINFGAGTVTLTGNQLSFVNSGALLPAVTNVSGKTATVNNDLVLATNAVFCAVNNLNLGGKVSGAGGLLKDGAGTMTVTGANSYGGGTLVMTGVLAIAHGQALGSGPVTVAAGGYPKLELSGNITVTNPLTLKDERPSYSYNMKSTAGDNTWDGLITVDAVSGNSHIDTALGSTLRITRGIVGKNGGVSFGSAGVLKIEHSPILLTNQYIYPGSSGLIQLNVGSNVFSGVGFWGRCTLQLGLDHALPTNVLVRANDANGGTLDLNGFSQMIGELNQNSTYPLVITNRGSLSAFTVKQGGSSPFTGLIGGNLTLSKAGNGTLVLSNANTYCGGTVISNGVLRLGVANALPSTGAVVVAGGSYDLGGFTATNGWVTVSGGGIANGTLAANSTVLAGTCSISAVIGGNGGLTKSGTGTAVLQNAMTYAGETVVSGGTLKLDYLPDGTVAYYNFNDSANLGLDGSSRSNALKTTGGSPQYSANGKFGGALYLDGASKLGTASGLFPSGVPTGAAPYTVSAYIQAATNCPLAGGWVGYGTMQTNQCNNFRLNGSTAYNAVWNYWWANDMGATLPNGSFTDGWHSVVGTWDGTTETLYLDGVNRASRTTSGFAVTAGDFVVGRTIGDAFFKGWVDDVLIADRALSATEIATLGIRGLNTSSLPAGTALRVRTGAVMDLSGVRQTVAALGGSGTVTGGTLTVTGRLTPGDTNTVVSALTVSGGLVLAAGVTNAFDCTSVNSDVVNVFGTLTLQGANTVQMTLAGAQTPPPQVTLFTFDSLVGGTNLTNWTVTGLSNGYRVRLTARANDIVLTSSLMGTMMTVK